MAVDKRTSAEAREAGETVAIFSANRRGCFVRRERFGKLECRGHRLTRGLFRGRSRGGFLTEDDLSLPDVFDSTEAYLNFYFCFERCMVAYRGQVNLFTVFAQ